MADPRRPNSFGDEAASLRDPNIYSVPGSNPQLPAAAQPLPMVAPPVAPSTGTPPPQEGPRTAGQILNVGAQSVMGGLRNIFGGSNGGSAAPDISGAMTANPALMAANAAPPAAPATLAGGASGPVALPADTGVNPLMGPPISAMTPAANPNPQTLGPNGNVTTLSGSAPAADRAAQMARDSIAQDALTLRQQQVQALRDPTPGLSVMRNPGPAAAQEFFDNANLRNAAAKGSWSPRWGYRGDAEAVAAANQPVQARAKLREISLQNEGRMNEATMRDATERRGQDQTSADRRYSSDQTLRGAQTTAAGQAARLAYDARKDDRDYQLNVAKYGVERADKQFTQRAQAQDDVQKQVTSMLPPLPDGKPDTAAAARYSAALNAQVAQRSDQLRAQLAKTPDRKDVAAELDALESKGLGAMDPVAVRKFIVGQQTAELAARTGTSQWNPFGTAAANSTAPITSLRERKGLFGSDYVSDRGDVIPARNLRDNGLLNQDLNTLIQR